MQKFLIYGGKGWVGQQIVDLLKDKNFVLGQARVDNEPDLVAEIKQINPTHVISLTGKTWGIIDGKTYPTIDYLEQPGKLKENIRDNLYSQVLLAMTCKKLNIHLTVIATGCIFEYDKDHPREEEVNGFPEEALPNFFGSS